MLSANALKVLEKRYLLRGDDGQISEKPEDLFWRVARAVALVEERWGADSQAREELGARFFQAMSAGLFLPNSPTLMNAGRPDGQLSACFVLPVPDTLEGIFETCKNAALIHKTGGGTGFSFNRLRPAHDRVATTCGVASGPVSFMTVYDAATEAIRQGGTRRGANMGILNIDHPDIEEFITCKRDTGKLNNFNISVAVTESFMRAVEADGDLDLVHPRTGEKVRTVRARALFDKIVQSAHASAEPGIVFLDRINAADPVQLAFAADGQPVPGTEDIEATNPCGEQPLGPYDACNLGSINVSRFVLADGSDFDRAALADMIQLSVRFLDDIVEANHYPLPLIEKAALGNRRIGLGVMGFAEMLVRLGIPYDCQQAVDLAGQLMSFIQEKAHEASRHLAGQRGVFPNWQYSRWKEAGLPMRNATVTTIAPTGTISIIAGTSSGIEPLFAVSYVRRVMGGTELVEVNPLFEKIARENGFYSEELLRRIAEEGGVQNIDSVPDNVRRIFRCAHDIGYEWHVRMQAEFQKHTDCAVSKTINMPAGASEDDVRQAFLSAWHLGLKGITVYRDTVRTSQVLNIGRTDPLKKADSAGREGTATSPRAARVIDSSVPASAARHRRACLSPVEDGARQRGRNARAINKSSKEAVPGCPECGTAGASLVKFEACRMCRSCGYTKC